MALTHRRTYVAVLPPNLAALQAVKKAAGALGLRAGVPRARVRGDFFFGTQRLGKSDLMRLLAPPRPAKPGRMRAFGVSDVPRIVREIPLPARGAIEERRWQIMLNVFSRVAQARGEALSFPEARPLETRIVIPLFSRQNLGMRGERRLFDALQRAGQGTPGVQIKRFTPLAKFVPSGRGAREFDFARFLKEKGVVLKKRFADGSVKELVLSRPRPEDAGRIYELERKSFAPEHVAGPLAWQERIRLLPRGFFFVAWIRTLDSRGRETGRRLAGYTFMVPTDFEPRTKRILYGKSAVVPLTGRRGILNIHGRDVFWGTLVGVRDPDLKVSPALRHSILLAASARMPRTIFTRPVTSAGRSVDEKTGLVQLLPKKTDAVGAVFMPEVEFGPVEPRYGLADLGRRPIRVGQSFLSGAMAEQENYLRECGVHQPTLRTVAGEVVKNLLRSNSPAAVRTGFAAELRSLVVFGRENVRKRDALLETLARAATKEQVRRTAEEVLLWARKPGI